MLALTTQSDCPERKPKKKAFKAMRRGRDERLFWPLRISRFYVCVCVFFSFDTGAEICESSLHIVTSLDSHHM